MTIAAASLDTSHPTSGVVRYSYKGEHVGDVRQEGARFWAEFLGDRILFRSRRAAEIHLALVASQVDLLRRR